jgi:hypothetical protein
MSALFASVQCGGSQDCSVGVDSIRRHYQVLSDLLERVSGRP